MNKVYQVIWNKARGMYVVVSELAKQHGKNAGSLSIRGGQTGSKLAIAVAIALGVSTVFVPFPSVSYAAKGDIVGEVNNGIENNQATGSYATVTGGEQNIASGTYASVSGGNNNTAAGKDSFVGGGSYNKAYGQKSSIIGGYNNKTGNQSNKALGHSATAIGGQNGSAEGDYSVVIGGGTTTSWGVDAIAIGAGSVATKAKQISFGNASDASKNNKLTNIADGTDNHDAASVGQMNTALAKKADATALAAKADKTAVEANTAAIAANRTDIEQNKSDIAALQNGLKEKVDTDDVYKKADADKQFATNTALAAKADQTALAAEQSARENADTSLQSQITTNTQSINDHTADLASIHQELNDIDADTLRAEGQAAKTAATNAQARADEAHQAATEAKETADKMQDSVHNTLKISDDNVLQKQTVKTDKEGEVTTEVTDASELIINEKEKNQIHFSKDEGIVVGLASTKMDAEGFTAGGHDYDAAGSALMADGRIKGANGNFTVDANGKVSAKGVDAGGEKITNVAAGTDATDAVNVSQLSQTDQRVSNVENRISKLDNRVDKVGANAAAMANLHPMDYDPDSKFNMAAAVGNYGSASAAALGVFYQPNERVMMNLSTSFGNGENMVGAGIAFKLGHIEKTASVSEDKGTNAALLQRVNELQAQNEAQGKKIDELQAKLNAVLSVLSPEMLKQAEAATK